MTISVLFASMASFWTLRPEMATHGIASFVLGTPPITIASALVLFGGAIGLISWAGGTALTWLLTTALPPDLMLFAVKSAAGFIAGSAVGALVVTVSPQPAMIIGTYLGCLIIVPFLSKATTSQQLIAALLISIVSTILSAVLLRRRCAL